MPHWEFFEAEKGHLYRITRHEPRAEVNCLWGRTIGSSHWELELLLDDCDGDCWVFRRNRTIRRPFALAVSANSRQIPYLAPEIQLLYKSHQPRAQDDFDFQSVFPRLEDEPREWLHAALIQTSPHHPWLSRFGG